MSWIGATMANIRTAIRSATFEASTLRPLSSAQALAAPTTSEVVR
jgi:hypothetical protein